LANSPILFLNSSICSFADAPQRLSSSSASNLAAISVISLARYSASDLNLVIYANCSSRSAQTSANSSFFLVHY